MIIHMCSRVNELVSVILLISITGWGWRIMRTELCGRTKADSTSGDWQDVTRLVYN